jgi:hypothetical protein
MSVFDEVVSFINRPQPARFESLALEVFRHQAERIPLYRAYLARLGIDPLSIHSIGQVPPVSTLAFKYAKVQNASERYLADNSRPVTSHAIQLRRSPSGALVFLTSGTSRGAEQRGRHVVPHPEVYRASAINHLRRMLFPDGTRLSMIALHPTADRMPESSLSQMITWCIDEFGDANTLCAATRSSVDAPAAMEFLRAACIDKRAMCILGTTASLGVMFEAFERAQLSICLPRRSRVMDTGGAKGQSVPLRPEEVVLKAQALLGIGPSMVINEYGMTEMCSQLYDATSFNSDVRRADSLRIKLAPPWLKPMALDPIRLSPVANGQSGMLAFFDLANVGSISALITEDIGIVQEDAVVILGRAAAAEARGCALAIDEFRRPDLARQSSSGEHFSTFRRQPEMAKTAPTSLERGSSGEPLQASQIRTAAARLREAIKQPTVSDPELIGAEFKELAEVISACSESNEAWRAALSEMAYNLGYSEKLLRLSLSALVQPLRAAGELARKLRRRHELIGVIAPGNIPGAGLHEVVAALSAGCAVLVKTSVAEPEFFRALGATLRQLDARFGSDLGARLEVFCWGRERVDLTRALFETCDRVAALGNDATIGELGAYSERPAAQISFCQQRGTREFLFGFGARVSGVALMREAVLGDGLADIAGVVALDCALFDQRGCLSPHHIFVEGSAREFAGQLAAALEKLSEKVGDGKYRRIALENAAATRRVRETERWRALGGEDVELWEDRSFDWTVVFDRDACFTISPGFRTVYVSPFSDLADLERRLQPIAGKLEGFALAGDEMRATAVDTIVRRLGATYVCTPGNLQSPPLEWPHGGGEFIRLMQGAHN